MASTSFEFPDFDDLLATENRPSGSLWGFFDRDGHKDEIGTLNLLTADVILEAAKEIKHGRHIQLDLPLHHPEVAGFGRLPLQHNLVDMMPKGFVGFDDEIHLNTQSSSQWDSLKHFGHQRDRKFYNGLTLEEAKQSSRNAIHNVCQRGGIVARGILVDWLAWWEHRNQGREVPPAISNHTIFVADIRDVLDYQKTEIKQGDILLVRTGYVRWQLQASSSMRASAAGQGHSIGMANNMETVRWLYNNHFAAVAADNPAFEATPIPEECCLHEWLLCHWGTHIGELWNLEDLSRVCKELGKWSFFLTSAPLHVEGAVASPPGAIAVF
ncbi:hypothetical protein BJ166DRAFT_611555, partial [Pestalotiopsis sp. NC0098]